jgi:murein DD-endopeptidase MepM/ murein hydrolase activator NlpD
VFALDTPQVSAFWPFYSTVDAAGSSVIPSADTPALDAPTNSDPTPPGPSQLATSQGTALISNQGPNGVPSGDSIIDPASTQISTYLVKSGDTLSQIAENYGVSVNTIVWANNLGSTKAIHPGQTLVILPVSGVEHTVVKGDTLASVAKKYGGEASDIADYNGLDPAAALVVGSEVIIPDGELTASAGATKASGAASSVSSSAESGSNPYRGGSGPLIDGYYENPVAGDLVSQGLHGENAVDLAAPRGSAIHAAAAGTIIVAADNGAWNGGYGNYVVIAHDNGTQTLYAHMITGSVTVAVGQTVAQGDVIGKVGMTGDATGPHVHLEIRGAFNIFAACPVGSHPGAFTCS